MNAKAVAARMGEIDGALEKLADKWVRRHEDEPLPGAGGGSLGEELAEFEGGDDEATIKQEGVAAFLEFVFAEGPHPGVVMRRFYAYVKKFQPKLVWDAGYRELGMLLGESHAAMEWRISVIIDGYSEAKGLRGVKAPWQRTQEACTAYSEAQKGNDNRTGGKKSARRKVRRK